MESTSPQGEFFDYIDIDAIDNKHNIVTAPKHLPVKNAPSRATRLVCQGDVLFSMVRPYLRNIARVESDGCIASTGFYVCRCSNAIDSKYCYYLMLSDYVVEGLNQYMKGDNSPSINNNHITSWFYPIPPIAEQNRICNCIDSLFSMVDILSKDQLLLQKTIDLCRTKILDLAIHGKLVPQDPNDEPAIELLKRINPNFKPSDNLHYNDSLPKSWIKCHLEDICVILDSQRRPINAKERAARSESSENKYPYYGATGQVGTINDYLLNGDYILLGEDGAPFLDSFAAKAYSVSGKIWVNNHAHILSPKINNNFFLYYLNYIDYHPYMTGSTRLKLTQEAMKKIVFVLPPLMEQQRIVEKIEKLFSVLDFFGNNCA